METYQRSSVPRAKRRRTGDARPPAVNELSDLAAATRQQPAPPLTYYHQQAQAVYMPQQVQAAYVPQQAHAAHMPRQTQGAYGPQGYAMYPQVVYQPFPVYPAAPLPVPQIPSQAPAATRPLANRNRHLTIEFPEGTTVAEAYRVRDVLDSVVCRLDDILAEEEGISEDEDTVEGGEDTGEGDEDTHEGDEDTDEGDRDASSEEEDDSLGGEDASLEYQFEIDEEQARLTLERVSREIDELVAQQEAAERLEREAGL